MALGIGAEVAREKRNPWSSGKRGRRGTPWAADDEGGLTIEACRGLWGAQTSWKYPGLSAWENGWFWRPAGSPSTWWRRSRPCSKRACSSYGAAPTERRSWRWSGLRADLRGLLPKSVREVIRSRLSRLSPAASELLRAGAVLERGFSFESVVEVAGLGEAEGLRALEELIERHLLREEAGSREEEQLLYPSSPTPSPTRR